MLMKIWMDHEMICHCMILWQWILELASSSPMLVALSCGDQISNSDCTQHNGCCVYCIVNSAARSYWGDDFAQQNKGHGFPVHKSTLRVVCHVLRITVVAFKLQLIMRPSHA